MVTPEMIEAGRRAWQSAIKDRNLDQWLEHIYLAMKALDPEIEGLREALDPFARVYRLCPPGFSHRDEEGIRAALPTAWPTWGDLKRANDLLAQTQSQAQDDER
jgi:hypothetical protein